MGKLNKFFYVKGTAKRDLLISADRINGVVDTDANTLKIQFDNLGNDRDSAQGIISFDITSGKAKEFLEELLSASARNSFTVIADGVSGATPIPVGFFLNFATGTGITASQFSTGNAASPAVSDGFTSVDREVLVTVTCSAHDVTAETGETADYEVQLDFKMLGSE